MLSAMDIPTPRLVINLLLSFNRGKSFGSNVHFSKCESTVISHHTHSEVNATELQRTDRRLRIFLKDCVLPVAISQQAVVLVYTDVCHLGMAFTDICQEYAR